MVRSPDACAPDACPAGRPAAQTPAEERLRTVPWEGLAGLAASLDAPLAEVLAGAPAERVLDRLLRTLGGLDQRARAAVAEAVFGVGLWRRRLRVQLHSARGPEEAGPRLLLAALLRDLGGRQDAAALLELDPSALPPPGPPPASLADRYSLPDWLAAELERAAGAEAELLADALCAPGPVCLRANLLRTTPPALAARIAGEGVPTRPGRLAPHCLIAARPRPNVLGLPAFREGLLEVQDEGSQLLGALVGARPGEAVLDPCAGAGGKSLLLAADVGSGGQVHAADPDPERLSRLRARAARAGADGIVRVHGAVIPLAVTVDRALVDAPCSELGALRRGPDLRWRIEPARFAGLPDLQLEILVRAAAQVRPGGRLVYATCTFRREEDEAVARAFESLHPEYQRARPEADASVVTAEGFVRTWPHRHGTDAFFAAVWERTL
jgi:16S rRNA (cytosine967-C5)-methyltransferase